MKTTFFLIVAIIVAIFLKMPSTENAADSADSDSQKNVADSAESVTDNSCLLTAEKCRLPIQKGFVEINIPQPIPAGRGFEIVLEAQDFQIETATAHFEGLSMVMSAPELEFSKKAENTENAETWQARAFLPICLTGTMRWRMTLNLNQNETIPLLVESGR